ncbi:MAG: HAD family hydrolase [Promethearchaeota archaeon]
MARSENFKIGFVFDLDGTLINSMDIRKIIAKEIYEKFNIKTNDKIEREIEELIYELVGGENRKHLTTKVMLSVFKKLGLSFFQRIKALMMANKIFKRESKNITLYEGVKELFQILDEKNIPYTIATTSSKKEVEERLSKFPEFYKKFDGKIITRSDVKNLKPHPESIIKASKIMNVPINNIIVIGDMYTDVQMGKNVHAITVGVATGFLSKEQLKQLEPDFIVETVADVKEILSDIMAEIEKRATLL